MKLIEIRNLLYRIKTKMLYDSNSPLSTIRKGLWIPAGVYEGVYELYRSSYPCFSEFEVEKTLDENIFKRYKWENKTYSFQSDIVYCIDNEVFLEPSKSLGLMKDRYFVEQTKSPAHKYLLPSPLNLLSIRNIKNITRFDSAILFDGYASKNHYHFFDDALNPLMMMMDSGVVDMSLPIIYNHKLESYKWFKHFRNISPFNELNWKIQGANEWIVCGSLYKGVATKKWWGKLYELIDKSAIKNPTENIFIERKPQHARSFSNKAEIHKILKKFNFNIYILDEMSYDDQIELFSRAKNIIAHHGAGLANLIHTDIKNTSLMELFSSDLLQPHYYWLTQELGIKRYDALIGSGLDLSTNYWVDPILLENKIDSFLNND